MIIAFINVVAALRILQVFPFDFSAVRVPLGHAAPAGS